MGRMNPMAAILWLMSFEKYCVFISIGETCSKTICLSILVSIRGALEETSLGNFINERVVNGLLG